MARTKRIYNPKDCDQPLPSRLVKLRKDLTVMKEGKISKVTQADIAEILSISKANYACYETGETIPPIDKIIKLAEYYNVSTDYLLGLSDAKTNDITETAICEYLNLDIETVRALHDSAGDKKLHIVIDFLFKEEELLKLITQYAWSILPKLIETTKYQYLIYEDLPYLMKHEHEAFSDLIYHLQSFCENFYNLCKEHEVECDPIIRDYAARNIDANRVIRIMTELDADAPILHELFRSYDSKKLEEYGVFYKSLNHNDGNRFFKLVRLNRSANLTKGIRYENIAYRQGNTFIETASEILRLRAKQRKIAEFRDIPENEIISYSVSEMEAFLAQRYNAEVQKMEEEHGDKKRENN